MTRLAGVDISGTSVRGVLYDPETHRLLASEEVETTRPRGDFSADSGLKDALSTLARRLRLGSVPLAVTADFDLVVTRTHLPFQDPKRIAEVVGFHIEERVPFEVTDWLVEHVVSRRGESGVDLVLFAARRRQVEELLNTFLEAGIYPQLIVPRALALFRLTAGPGGAMAGPGGPTAEPARAVVWVEPGHVDVVVGRGGSVLLARALPVVGDSVTGGEDRARTIVADLRLSLWSAGVSPGECAVVVGGPEHAGELVLELLSAEVEGGPSPERPEGEAVSSVQPAASVLPAHASRTTGGGAEGGDVSGEPETGRYALAAGAALSLAREPQVDLARSLRSLGLALRAVSSPLTALLVAALVAGVLFFAFQVRRAWSVRSVVQANQRLLEETWDALYPGSAMPAEPLLRVLSDLQARSSGGEVGRTRVAPLALLGRVVEALPEEEGFQITGFRVTSGEVVLSCSAKRLSSADVVVAAIQSRLGATVSRQSPSPLAGGRHAFDITVQWKDHDSGTSTN